MMQKDEVLQYYHKEQKLKERLIIKNGMMTINNRSRNAKCKYLIRNSINAPRLTADNARHEPLYVEILSADTRFEAIFRSERNEIVYDPVKQMLRLRERRDWKLVNFDIDLSSFFSNQIVQMRPVFLRPEMEEVFPRLPENQPKSEIEFLLHPSARLEVRYLDWLNDGDTKHGLWLEQNCVLGSCKCQNLELIVYREAGERADEMAFVIELHHDRHNLFVCITEVIKGRKNRRFKYSYLENSVLHPADSYDWCLEIFGPSEKS